MSDNLTTPVAAATVVATHQFTDLSHGSVAVITDQNKVDAIGDVGATPAANTILGRLKAIATALAGLPATVGIKTAANSLSIAPASDAGMATSAKQDALLSATAVTLPPFPITPHATNPLERAIAGLSVSVAGTVVFHHPADATGTDRTVNLPAGFFPMGGATHIRATSTATGLTGF